MAKKKTVENIKAAPVLRASSGGDQPTPTPEQTGTRTYQIMDPWKDRDVVNLVDIKSVDGEITDVKVNGEPAGGDINVARVNLKNVGSSNQTYYAPELIDGDDGQFLYVSTVIIARGSTNQINVPLISDFGSFIIPDFQIRDLDSDGNPNITLLNGEIHIMGPGHAEIS